MVRLGAGTGQSPRLLLSSYVRLWLGRVAPQPKLPGIEPGQQTVVVLGKRGYILEETVELREIAECVDAEKQPGNQIVVSEATLSSQTRITILWCS